MKPQIVSNGYGFHNDALEHSRQRILKGATWKRQRTIILIPSADLIPAKVALSHWNLMFPPNQPVIRMLCLGMEVGHAYSSAIEEILKNPELSSWEYLLTIEADNIPPPDGFLRLVESMDAHPEYACVGGLYWTKGEGGVPHIWGDPSDPVLNYRPQVPMPDTLQECCGSSMGFHLWRLAMFKDERLKRPWFKTLAGPEGLGTQDLAFWTDARQYGYRTAVDTRVRVGHYDLEGKYGPPDMVW